MAQTVEKQPFCNICADLTVELESLSFEEGKKTQEVVVKENNFVGNQLLKLVNKTKYNSKYLNEVVNINDYKTNIDRKINYRIPPII
ncbi:MAG: hypothetical protein ACFFKA_08900 [Candidatus Thorarchaeota archaeon]